jgi:NAD(P)-dependent dehydrogenase (short-subunit alcohol dehydrogenase family)
MNILVTGGASGLGEAITRKLAEDSANTVYFTFNKSAEKAAALEKDLANIKGFKCDFSDAAEFVSLLGKLPEWNIEVLVNNAVSTLRVKHFHSYSADELKEGFLNDTMPTAILMQKAVGMFRKKKSGRIITVLTSGLIGRPPAGYAEYTAGKAYLLSMSKSIAAENAGFNIVSNCISPAFMQTSLTSAMDERMVENMIESHPLKRLLQPLEVAEVVHFLVYATPHMNGVNIPLNAAASIL